MNTDPIADMLSRIRNAIAVGQSEVSMPHSNLKESVAMILTDSGFLSSAKNTQEAGRKQLVITINDDQRPALITELKRISRPGRRQYIKAKEIPRVKGGRGLVVVSTSQGIMSGDNARQKGLGGELICEVF
jgi:small subunit ribosomal protein S8